MIRALTALVLLAALAGPPSPANAVSTERVALGSGFEANHGQMDPRALFRLRSGSYTGFLTRSGVVIDPAGEAAAVEVELLQARDPEVIPAGALPGHTYYRVGRAAAAQATGPRATGPRATGAQATKAQAAAVPRYAEVTYRGLYPGIDLRFLTVDGALRYDFVVAPGGAPEVIRLAVRGAQRVSLDEAGGLVIESAGGGRLRQPAPFVFQQVDGERNRVEGRYRLLPGHRVAFEIASFDRRRELVIDPTVLDFSTYLGGGDRDILVRSAFDPVGNAIVAGYTVSADFPEIGALQSSSGSGQWDGFVSKISADGSSLLWSTYLGGTGADRILDVAVDAAGAVYVTGETTSQDLPLHGSAVDRTCGTDGYCNGGFADAFVMKLKADGSTLLLSTYLGGESDDLGRGIAVAGDDTIYLTGETRSGSFPTTVGAFQRTLGGQDAFVTRLDNNAALLVFSTLLGGGRDDSGSRVAIGSGGQAVVVGATDSDDFPLAGDPFSKSPFGLGAEIWAARLLVDGSDLVFSTYLGGSGADVPLDLRLDEDENLWIVGTTQSPDFPVEPAPGAASVFQDQLAGTQDGFLAGLLSDGSGLVSGTYFGGSWLDGITSLSLQPAGGILLGGWTSSDDLPVANSYMGPSAAMGDIDGFVARFAGQGSVLLVSSYFGGSEDDVIYAVEEVPGGSFSFAGTTASDLDLPLRDALQGGYGGGGFDGFVAQLTWYLPLPPPPSWPPPLPVWPPW